MIRGTKELVEAKRVSLTKTPPPPAPLKELTVERDSYAACPTQPHKKGRLQPFVKHPESYKSNGDLLLTELRLLREQGLDEETVTRLDKELRALPSTTELMEPAEFAAWASKLSALSAGLTQHEPTELEAIRALLPAPVALPPLTLTREQIRNRVAGGWVGRACGNVLGKPVEGWSRQGIEAFLHKKGLQSLDFYLEGTAEDHAEHPFHKSWSKACLNFLKGSAPRDDDMDYPILALLTAEGLLDANPGREKEVVDNLQGILSTRDVAHILRMNLPVDRVFTAEKIGVRNLMAGIIPEKAGSTSNPYREWIGASIRADLWGYISPGNPERAATLAHHDAVLTHTGNGVYGEMFFAALVAASFSAKSLDQALDAAVAQIPAGSRFSQMIKSVREWEASGMSWDDCWRNINLTYGNLHWVHVLNNGAIAVAGLLYGKGDFAKTVTLTTLGGYDTDSNTATTGSVVGVLHGESAVPESWKRPISQVDAQGRLNPHLASAVFGHSDVSLLDLADRTMRLVPEVSPEFAAQ